MISTEQVQLGNRDFIYSEGKDWSYLLFGATFLFFGSLTVHKYFTSVEKELPMLIFGSMFSLIGVYAFIFWIIGLVKKLRVYLAKKRNVPLWEYDYKWNSRGASDKVRWVLFKRFFFLLLFGSFSATIGVLLYLNFDPEEKFLKPLFIGLSVLLTVLFIWRLVVVLLRYFKFGSSILLYNRFPFFLGETLDAELVNAKAARQIEMFEVSLRCIVEVYETYYDSSKRKNVSTLVTYQIYKDTKEITPSHNTLQVNFNLPDANYETSINSKRETRYWELEIKGKDEGPDYSATFLVPVYLKEVN